MRRRRARVQVIRVGCEEFAYAAVMLACCADTDVVLHRQSYGLMLYGSGNACLCLALRNGAVVIVGVVNRVHAQEPLVSPWLTFSCFVSSCNDEQRHSWPPVIVNTSSEQVVVHPFAKLHGELIV